MMQTTSLSGSMSNISSSTADFHGSTSSLNATARWNPGVFIDIDGVVLNGGKPYEWTVEAIRALWDNKIPFVFVTNGTYCSAKLVDSLTEVLHLPITSDHVIVAPSPCSELTDYHNKRVLVCCQEDSIGLISE
jgi:ribonucleotide monophosphatase NagD (HAD superfamily)